VYLSDTLPRYTNRLASTEQVLLIAPMNDEPATASLPSSVLANGDPAATPARRQKRAPTITSGPPEPQDTSVRRKYLTVGEIAEMLRTSPKAVYAMASRGQLPGVTKLGRRLLIRADMLLDWLDQKRAPSPKE
jgi:excisionase family DNA binding protein